MINHGNRGVPSFRIQISPFSYECPVSCPFTVHEQPKLESHHNDNQSPPPSPPSKGTLAICLVSLFTQQPLRSVSSSSPSSSSTSSSSSSSSPPSFDLTFGFFDIHFPSTQRCDESDRLEHP